jgi:NTE family protein
VEKLGLVLAGGGGKGAYEIGVWQALRDLGLEQSVTAVSGTSVGALNAALFATGDLERARTVWRDLSPTHIIFSPDPDKAEAQIAQLLSSPGLGQRFKDFLHRGSVPDPLVPVSVGATASTALFFLRNRLLPTLSQLLMSGIISADGLGEMIDGAVDCARLAASPVRCYATCLRIPWLKPDRFLLNGRAPEDIRAILQASAAIPFFFPMGSVEKRLYLDGGLPPWGDNVPVRPLYELEGCRTILVVHLSGSSKVDAGLFPEARLVEIFPSAELGGPAGTFDFTAKGARWRMELGYRDGVEQLAGLCLSQS